jgi:hypothetical protein
VNVYANGGDGTFTGPITYRIGPNPLSVAAGDVSGDGLVDLVVASSYFNTASVLTNQGAGTFAARLDYSAGLTPYSVALGELNGDGRTDLVLTDFGSNTVSLLFSSCAP